MPISNNVLLLVITLLFGKGFGSLNYNQYVVPCDHSTASCVCPPSYNSVKVDVCVFTFLVDIFQTFTSYRIDPVSNRIAVPHGGRAWYINETTGEFMPFPDGRTVCQELTPDCTQPYTVDGYSYRTYYSINGRIPGPTLVANFNQTIVVNVTNIMDSESLSIHWHGMHQVRTNWMDGVQHITQCGINSGTSFTYVFQADPPGTHWYHSHSGSQRNEGIYGALIVQEDVSLLDKVRRKIEIDFQDIPEDHTLLFQDWQNADASDIVLLSTSNTHFYYTSDAPDPAHYTVPDNTVTTDGTVVGQIEFWAGLINGRGRHPSVSYNKTRLSIFNVSPKTSYRFRLVGSQHVFAFMVSFDEHQLKVLSKDGVYIEPLDVDYLIVQPGERYDVILQTKPNDEVLSKNNFVIRAETLEVNKSSNTFIKGHLAEAILHYDINAPPTSTEYSAIVSQSIPVANTCTTDHNCIALNCPFKSFPISYNIECKHVHDLQLLNEIPSDDPMPNTLLIPDKTLFFNFGPEGVGESSSVNARNNKLPSSPLTVLNSTQLISIEANEFCHDLNDPETCDRSVEGSLPKECVCANVHEVPVNETVMLVLSAVSPNTAPASWSSYSVHLHGHHFQVLDIQFGEYSPTGKLISANKDISCGGTNHCTVPGWKQPRQYQYNNKTVKSDTITVPAGGYVVVSYQSNNPGYWYLHCVSELHHIPGMGVVLAEGIDRLTPPPKGMKFCGNFLWTAEEYFQKLLNGRHSTVNNNTSSTGSSVSTIYYVAGSSSAVVLILIIGVVLTVVFIAYKRFSRNSGFIPKSYSQVKTDPVAVEFTANHDDELQFIDHEKQLGDEQKL